MTSEFIYLDYAASAPVREEAFAALQEYREKPFAGANPNSLHTLGRQASQELEASRKRIAQALGGGFRPTDIVFTSGGTEANNLAIYGIAEAMRKKDPTRTKVIFSAIEHDSVLDLVPAMRERGFEVVLIPPQSDGAIHPEDLQKHMDDHVALVSIMHANNETGIVNNIDALAQVTHEFKASFHTDAIQAFARIPLAINQVDAVSIASHKIGAPIGAGVLALRRTCPFKAQTFGGGQELGRRPGTQDVQSAYVFSKIAQMVVNQMGEVRPYVAALAQQVYDRLCAEGTHILPTTTATMDKNRLPGLVSVVVDGLDSETLLLQLDAAKFEVSAGSACSSASLDPSHVLTAMGIPRNLAFGSLRISFDERVSSEALDAFCDTLLQIVKSYR
ncbi:cysteine desulfurase family protein [Atopobium fossor]|uniref:cysteine desulfurase family protein n=1 Tax=Atopobium fossor TaxID=39487 RepID=UPI000423B4BC|nr:cysteine desulfurase family protein [Atopobium fossor]